MQEIIEPMKLEEGKFYKFKELAEWFGIEPDSFTKSTKGRLNKLKDYAEFVRVGNRIKIIEVYQSVNEDVFKKIIRKLYIANKNITVEEIKKITPFAEEKDIKKALSKLRLQYSDKRPKITLVSSEQIKYLPNVLGIYCIKDKHTKRVLYVGQSIHIRQRLLQHEREIANKSKRKYIKLAEHEREYEILEECEEREELNAREAYYINTLRPLYNAINFFTGLKKMADLSEEVKKGKITEEEAFIILIGRLDLPK